MASLIEYGQSGYGRPVWLWTASLVMDGQILYDQVRILYDQVRMLYDQVLYDRVRYCRPVVHLVYCTTGTTSTHADVRI